MDSLLIGALGGQAPTLVHLVTVNLSGATVRWLDTGLEVVWGADTYAREDATYGYLGGMGAIEDGADGQATVCELTILCDMTALALWTDPAEQGSVVTVHIGAVDHDTGLLVGEPDPLFRCELDQPRLGIGETLTLIYDCITEEARMLEANEEQRLTDQFQKSVWPGDTGYVNVTRVRRKVVWRRDSPNNAIQ